MIYTENRRLGLDKTGNIAVIAVPMGSSSTFLGNNLIKLNPNINSTLFNVSSGYLLNECSITYHPNDFAGFNAIAFDCKNDYFTYDGQTIRRVNGTTGAVIGSPTPVAGGISYDNSGIWVDNCNNVYVGTQTGVSIYNSSMAFVKTVNTGGPVYDIIEGQTSGEVLACGRGFVAALTGVACAPTTTVNVNLSPKICTGNTYTLPDGTIVTAGGIYKDTVTRGCVDTIYNINLTVLQSYSTTVNVSICTGSTYTLPIGTVVSAPGTYHDTLTKTNGCDSIINTVLAVDSVYKYVASDTICDGDFYQLPNGILVTTSGFYTDTVLSSTGCDSIFNVTLLVNPMPVANASSDATIYIGQSVNLTAFGGGTYNWSPSTGLSSTTDSTVTATPQYTTVYCVEVTKNNMCKDTACVKIVVETPCSTNKNLEVPNAFSPNGDNINDEIFLFGWNNCI